MCVLATEILWTICICEAMRRKVSPNLGEMLAVRGKEKRRGTVRSAPRGRIDICHLSCHLPHLKIAFPLFLPSSFIIILLSSHTFTFLGFESLSSVIPFFLHQIPITSLSALTEKSRNCSIIQFPSSWIWLISPFYYLQFSGQRKSCCI